MLGFGGDVDRKKPPAKPPSRAARDIEVAGGVAVEERVGRLGGQRSERRKEIVVAVENGVFHKIYLRVDFAWGLIGFS